ncbi:hypothetical protein M8J76_006227 [Diaphorina citri]|nr:hypothetical protein M8J76_006227 [Diaphorina citri]KAI5717856.1 hypothetical protein M8J77_012466 [Diaphorina citri]
MCWDDVFEDCSHLDDDETSTKKADEPYVYVCKPVPKAEYDRMQRDELKRKRKQKKGYIEEENEDGDHQENKRKRLH